MSEFKGQLLGMVLVIVLFAAISVAMKTMFTNEVSQISEQFTAAISSAA